MIEAQKKLSGFFRELGNIAKEIDLPDYAAKILASAGEVENRELIVPVVGCFSSGKSTLINNVISDNILPEAITPETSLATELRYCETDYIEAVRPDGGVKRYSVDEINALKDKAADYSFARLYLNNRALKEIAPLTLVDMPGFDSPLDQHNKAINEYLGRGCHFIVLSSAEDGVIHQTLLRRLKWICNFGATVSFFISKANLRTEGIVDDLLEHYRSTLEDNLDIKVNIKPLGKADGAEIIRLLKDIDADSIYYRLYKDEIAGICQELLKCINTRIRANSQDLDDNNEFIREMQAAVVRIQQKAADLEANAKEQYLKLLVRVVNGNIKIALDNALDYLVDAAASGNTEGAVSMLNDTVYETILMSVKDTLGDINESIAAEFAASLNVALPNIEVEGGPSNAPSNQFMDIIRNIFSPILISLPIPKYGGPIGSLVKLVLGIFGGLFAGNGKDDNNNNNNNKKALREKFENEVFPEVRRTLAADLPVKLEKYIVDMIDLGRDGYEETLNNQRKEIAASIEQKQNDAVNVQSQQEKYEAARKRIEEIKEAVNG